MKYQLLASFIGTLCVMVALLVTAGFSGYYSHWAWPLGGVAVLLFLFALTTPPKE